MRICPDKDSHTLAMSLFRYGVHTRASPQPLAGRIDYYALPPFEAGTLTDVIGQRRSEDDAAASDGEEYAWVLFALLLFPVIVAGALRQLILDALMRHEEEVQVPWRRDTIANDGACGHVVMRSCPDKETG